jgi:hypothetical protein
MKANVIVFDLTPWVPYRPQTPLFAGEVKLTETPQEWITSIASNENCPYRVDRRSDHFTPEMRSAPAEARARDDFRGLMFERLFSGFMSPEIIRGLCL